MAVILSAFNVTPTSSTLGVNYAVLAAGGNAVVLAPAAGQYFCIYNATVQATGAGTCDLDMQCNGSTGANISSTTVVGVAAATTYQSITLAGIANVAADGEVFVQCKASVGSVFTLLAASIIYPAPAATQLTLLQI